MSKRLPESQAIIPVLAVAFLAGFVFLVYEVSWNRLLGLVLGTTVSASTVVLSGFMAGFGGGALFWGRRAEGRRRLGRFLGSLLVGMALLSAVDFLLFQHAVPALYRSTAAGGSALPDSLMYALSWALLFLPAFLMGGVFPVASRLAAARPGGLATVVGRLYAGETLGSALGGLLTGFVLLGQLGQQATLLAAVGLNLAVGLWAFTDRRFDLPEGESSGPQELPSRPRRAARKATAEIDRRDLARAALTGALVCGFAILTLQVLWLRAFKVYLTNTSYSFALVSSLAILGIFTGSAIFHRRGTARGLDAGSLVGVLLGMIVTAALGLVVLVNFPQLFMFPLQETLAQQPVGRVLGLPALASLLIVFPPAVFSGYAFPLACSIFTTSRWSVSGDVGLVLAVNTVGSVIGPVVAAFVLIPWLGAVLGVVAVLVWLAAGALVVAGRHRAGWQQPVLAGVLATGLVVLILGPEIRTLPPSFLRFDRRVLFYQEAVEGTLSVAQDRDTRTQTKYTFVNNSAVIGSSYDAVKVVKMVGHYPFLLGGDIQDVLVIGFGIGVTTAAIASHDEVQTIECVELVEGLREASRYYRERNGGVADDPRLLFHSGDGRHYLQRTARTYDLISCDPTHPILGSGNLYTRDYFELCRDHLNPGGMVSQYLPLHKLRQEDLLGIIATFHTVFPECTVWLGHYHAVLVGSTEPLDLDFYKWTTRVARLQPDKDFYSEPHHLAATLVLDGEAVAALGSGAGINTDDLTYTEFFDTACLDPGNTAANLRFLQENRKAVPEMFHNILDTALFDRFVQGNNLLNESLYYGLVGDRRRSLEALQRACRVNPEDQEFPFLIRLNF
jgi:spermidine synthase